mmetsp:Transcript_29199/g.61991  ORF Transcript_29199/g.61991 Transcript_29199/m.61991 type:complete len:238 (+) Transcript_29199:272-985(+)
MQSANFDRAPRKSKGFIPDVEAVIEGRDARCDPLFEQKKKRPTKIKSRPRKRPDESTVSASAHSSPAGDRIESCSNVGALGRFRRPAAETSTDRPTRIFFSSTGIRSVPRPRLEILTAPHSPPRSCSKPPGDARPPRRLELPPPKNLSRASARSGRARRRGDAGIGDSRTTAAARRSLLPFPPTRRSGPPSLARRRGSAAEGVRRRRRDVGVGSERRRFASPDAMASFAVWRGDDEQ